MDNDDVRVMAMIQTILIAIMLIRVGKVDQAEQVLIECLPSNIAQKIL